MNTKTNGQILAATLRQVFKIGTRTRRYRQGVDLHIDMIEAIENAVQLPGYYSPEKTAVFRKAWGAVMSYGKHVRGYRIDGVLAQHINALSAYRFAALLGRMVDAGVSNTGEGERFFAELANELRSVAASPAQPATTEVTYYEVVWGDDEADRIVYTDEHDGTFLSETADVRATRKFLELSKHGVRCGFFVNGNLTAGENVTDGPDQRPAFLDDPELYVRWVAGELNDDGSPKVGPIVEHKTRTVLDAYQNERYVTKSNGSCGRFVRGDTSTALCSCGWKWNAGTRDEARLAARGHRLEAVA